MKTHFQIENTTSEEFTKQLESSIRLTVEACLKNIERPTQNRLLTREETAKLLSISLVTLWKWTNDNVIPAHRIGNRVRYKEVEIIEALQKINGNVLSKNHLV